MTPTDFRQRVFASEELWSETQAKVFERVKENLKYLKPQRALAFALYEVAEELEKTKKPRNG